MFWFCAGDCLLPRQRKCQPAAWLAVYVALSVWLLLCPSDIENYIELPLTLVGIVAVWSGYDRVVSPTFRMDKHRLLSTACRYTFFIYLFHVPTLNIVRKLLVIPFGSTSFGFAVSYLLSPWVFAAGWVLLGMLLRRYVPCLYSICVGGR